VQKEAGAGAKRGDQGCVTGGGGSNEDGIVAGSGTSSGSAGSVTGDGKSQAGADDLWTGAEDLSPDLVSADEILVEVLTSGSLTV